MIDCPYKHPVFRKKLYRFEVKFSTVACNAWFNREKKRTLTVVAVSRYHVAAALERYTWGDCFRVDSITDLGRADD
jgi:hypothetical protein